MNLNYGHDIYNLAKKLYPINRSLTGQGFRDSLKIIDEELGGGCLNIHEIKSGTKAYDWTVPDEWHINDAYIITPDGEKICDFKALNIHVLGYSEAIDKEVSLKELNEHLYSLENNQDAVPYVTSYYQRRWGFCIKHSDRVKLKDGIYKVFIDSKHDENGVLNYADYVIKSSYGNEDEILISTYLCHPSLANDNLSGPCVATYLIKELLKIKEQKGLKYNYRFVFIPETIGSIVYISKHLEHLQKNVKAGFVLTCLGDDMAYSILHSPDENTLADKVAYHVLNDKYNFKSYSFYERGSDERQYCSPLVGLPVVGICRSKYSEYMQYHTSLDNLDFISEKGLSGGFSAMLEIIKTLEINENYQVTVFCEPQLGKRGLYRTICIKGAGRPVVADVLAFANGKNDVIDIANKLNLKVYELENDINALLEHELIKKV